MLPIIRDDTLNVVDMQHITPNSKGKDYSDIPGGGHKRLKDSPTWLKVATALKKKSPQTQPSLIMKVFHSLVNACNYSCEILLHDPLLINFNFTTDFEIHQSDPVHRM